MATSGMKLVRKPKSAKIQYAEVRQEIKAALTPVMNEHVNARKRVVGNWSHRPDFKGTIGVGTKQIFLQVTVENKDEPVGKYGATVGDLWKWLDKTGTKAHDIPSNPNGKLLVFRWGGPGSYISKTSGGPARYGGPGIVQGGKTVYFKARNKVLKHPGFKARKFGEAINTDLKGSFDKAVRNGYSRGFKKIKR